MKNKTSQNILAQTNTQINRGVNDILFQFNVLLQKIKKIQNSKSIMLKENILALTTYALISTYSVN